MGGRRKSDDKSGENLEGRVHHQDFQVTGQGLKRDQKEFKPYSQASLTRVMVVGGDPQDRFLDGGDVQR